VGIPASNMLKTDENPPRQCMSLVEKWPGAHKILRLSNVRLLHVVVKRPVVGLDAAKPLP